MKASLFILCCLSAGLSQAATYVWTNASGNGIYGVKENWTVNGEVNGYYPQSMQDTAIIGAGSGQVTWSDSQNYFGATNEISLGDDSTLLCSIALGDFNVWNITLGSNSNLVFQATNALGLSSSFTLDFGTFSSNAHGHWLAEDIESFWTKGQTVSLAGTLDTSALTGTGTIELASVKAEQEGGDLIINTSRLNCESTSQMQVNVEQVTENGVTKVVVNYASVPEPATATLGLLGLGALLLRRKRN